MRIFSAVFILFVFASCSDMEEEKPELNWNKDKSVAMNKKIAMEEQLQINLYLARHPSWKMQKTGSGLNYYIYQKGTGEKATGGMVAKVALKINLVDETLCYETEPGDFDEFQIDQSTVETGIQEGIKKMQVGDKAKLIIPSHLAHGLVGDLDKIPPLAILVVDIHLIGLNE